MMTPTTPILVDPLLNKAQDDCALFKELYQEIFLLRIKNQQLQQDLATLHHQLHTISKFDQQLPHQSQDTDLDIMNK